MTKTLMMSDSRLRRNLELPRSHTKSSSLMRKRGSKRQISFSLKVCLASIEPSFSDSLTKRTWSSEKTMMTQIMKVLAEVVESWKVLAGLVEVVAVARVPVVVEEPVEVVVAAEEVVVVAAQRTSLTMKQKPQKRWRS